MVSTTLVCDVQRRSPIAMISLYGTLDVNSAARCFVTLRDCIADAPTAMLLDVAHVSMTSGRAFDQFMALLRDARTWPGTRVGLCAATDQVEALFEPYEKDERPLFYADVGSGMADAVGFPVAPRETIALAPDANSPAVAREFVMQTCSRWGVGRLAKLTTLIASELVTNAVVHARTQAVMALQLNPDALHVSVRDSDPRPMYRPAPGITGAHDGDHGRGLLILDAMADGWGTLPTATGKVVWATVERR